MRIDVEHTTRYTYGAPVFLEPQTIRLRPGGDDAQRLISYEMRITPEPAGTTELTDAEGNLVTRAWFDGLHESLQIDIATSVQTLRSNPYEFVILQPTDLPPSYAQEEMPGLERFLRSSADETVRTFAEEGPTDAQKFLEDINARIHSFDRYIRDTGDPLPAAETLSERSGSCRDLAMLFIEAARARGVAARFVSGYTEGDPDEPEQHMHAWAEAYLPEVGWRGFDPTFGLAVADRHIWLARAPEPAAAAPTSGSFRGSVSSEMTASVKVRVSER